MTFTGPTRVVVSAGHAYGPGKVHAALGRGERRTWCFDRPGQGPHGDERDGDWSEVTCKRCVRVRRSGP